MTELSGMIRRLDLHEDCVGLGYSGASTDPDILHLRGVCFTYDDESDKRGSISLHISMR